MSILNNEEKAFLNKLCNPSFVMESTKSERKKILNLAIAKFKENGFKPNVSKSTMEGWVSGKNDDCCIAALGSEYSKIEKTCTEINKLIKPLGAKISPDNYGTAFIHMVDKEVLESVNDKDDVTIITDLYNKLKSFDYTFPFDDMERYRHPTPSEFEKMQGGICWDFTMYQAHVFSKERLNFTNYFIVLGTPEYDCHTFTVVKDSGMYYYIEASFKRIQGVYSSRNLNDIFDFIIQNMMEHVNVSEIEYEIHKYKQESKFYGYTTKQFMDYMCDKTPKVRCGKMVLNNTLSKLDVVTESYISNYIKNKFLLYKMGKHPEMTRKAMVSFMKTLTTSFKESLKDPEIQKLQKNPKRDQLFAIKYSTTFKDGMEVCIAFCYDERSFTPGAAYYDTGLKQYVIILYPNFFESGNIEQMLFIFLHELGHIRLGHCDYRNFHPDPNRRLNQMLDGKVEYGELNADLYAALNGAKLYSILGEYIPADADKKYNYTYTNQELANRYIHTAKGYRKLRGEKYIEEKTNLDIDDSDIKRVFGYTSDDGIYNACVEVKGEKKILRGRSEVIIIKDDEIFLCFDNKNPDDYRLPGGSWDDGEDHSKAAIREAKEEARINCKNPEFIQSYTEVYDTPKKWVKENIPEQFWWYGYYTKFYIAEYSGKYTGKVDKEDQDKSMAKKGDFYKISEVINKLRPVHKEGLTNYLEYKKESTIDYDMDDNLEILESLTMESSSDSHIILDAIYPNVEKVLSTPMGDKEFRRLVENFVDRNTDKLYEPCPISMIPFTDAEKAKYFNLFGFNEKQLAKEIESGLKAVSDTANFRLLKQNPIFSVFYMVLRFYILKNDESGINATLIIHALSSYPSIFSKYFKYGANEGIMRYTADHLTEKFIFKQEKHVFGALRKSIESAYVFLKPFFKEASDKEVVRYIQRVRNDQNSMIKKIASEYHKNRDAGNSVSTQAETWDNGSLIDDYQNDTSKVESLASRVVISILTNGIDLSRLKVAATFAQLSITELRYYLVKILIDSKNTEIDEFVTAVLFIYLYDEKHTVEEIRSKMYISFGIELFRKTNANNTNIKTIKTNLDKWAEETGIHAKYRREPTRIAYKKGIYWYILLTIQANV